MILHLNFEEKIENFQKKKRKKNVKSNTFPHYEKKHVLWCAENRDERHHRENSSATIPDGFVFASTENQNRRPSSTLQGTKDVRARSRRFGEIIVVGGGSKVDVATGPVFGRVESDGERHVRAIGESVRGFRGDGRERGERRLRRGGRRGERGVFEREGNGRTSETKFDLS